MIKKLVLTLSVSALAAFSMSAQTGIHMVVFDENVPVEAAQSLEHKLDYILSYYGYATADYPERIAMSAKIDVTENLVSPTNPPRVSKKIDLTVKIGDAIDNVVFSAASIPLNGIGVTETKAFISAFSSLKPDNKYVKRLFSVLDEAMKNYYAENEQIILDRARSMALAGDFDQAIACLISVPPIDSECYKACQDKAVEYYVEKVNEASSTAYSNARAAWTASKDKHGAATALSYLKQVSPAADIYSEALALWDEISDKIDRDEVEAKEHVKQVYADHVQFRSSIVDAVKAVGVAFGQGQPQNVTKIVRYW